MLTTLELAPDAAPENIEKSDHCGSCRACLDICPTDAFPAPYQIDARRCISYLTIEHKGPIAREFRAAMGNRIFGCDDCLAVCPWNKYARAAHDTALLPHSDLTAPKLAALARLDDDAFGTMFAGTPVKRLGRARFIRNELIAIGNSGNSGNSGKGGNGAGPALVAASLIPSVEPHLADPESVVRGAAVWALSQLLKKADFAALRDHHLPAEPDPDVRTEWEAELSPLDHGPD